MILHVRVIQSIRVFDWYIMLPQFADHWVVFLLLFFIQFFAGRCVGMFILDQVA